MGISRSCGTLSERTTLAGASTSRLRELAAVRVSYGYRRRHILLRREGWPVNRKLIERLYREEGLTLKRKRPKRQLSAVRREQSAPAGAINERWGRWASSTTRCRMVARFGC